MTLTLISREATARDHPVAVLTPLINTALLEQFATTLAAMAPDQASPETAMMEVLEAIAANLNVAHRRPLYSADRLLQEKAAQIGYSNYHDFIHDLLIELHGRLRDVRFTRLSAADRRARYQ